MMTIPMLTGMLRASTNVQQQQAAPMSSKSPLPKDFFARKSGLPKGKI